MTINLELSKSGIQKAIKDLQNYSNSIDEKMQTLATELCKVGVPVVIVHYVDGFTEGNSDCNIEIEPTEHGCVLRARGNDVCFLEFGGGVTTAIYDGEGQEGLPPVYPGSWSESEGTGQFAEKGFWFYGGKKYDGIEAKLGLYYASIEMRNRAVETARRVFK